MKISMMKSMRWITGLTGDCLADLLELPHNEVSMLFYEA